MADDAASYAPGMSSGEDAGLQAGTEADPDPLAPVARSWRRAGFSVSLLAVCGIAVLVLLARAWPGRMQWGDVPTWVLAGTSLLALAAAVFAGLVAYAVLAVELRRDRRSDHERAAQREDDRRSQAAKVAAWFDRWTEAGNRLAVGAVISNASDLPVYDIRVSFCVAVAEASGLTWRQGERYSSPELMHIVAPGRTRAEMPEEIFEAEAAEGNRPKWLVAIEFTDSTGNRWLRDARGRLGPAG
jgi:hypothetical protein